MAMSARQLRQLGEIESELEFSQPRLTAMFDMFAELTSGESPNGLEQLPGRAWVASRWTFRPEMIGVLMLIVVAVTLGVLIAVGSHSAPRACLAATAQSQARPAVPAWPPANRACPRYITSK